MTIVATSIPVLRVVFKQAFNSAITGYTGQSKSRSNPSNNTSLADRMGSRQISRKTEMLVSGEFSKDVFGKQQYVEMDDLEVDEHGRVTSSSPEAWPDSSEHHVTNRLV
jgi:cation transport regulator ChaB